MITPFDFDLSTQMLGIPLSGIGGVIVHSINGRIHSFFHFYPPISNNFEAYNNANAY